MLANKYTCDRCGKDYIEGFSLKFVIGAMAFERRWEYADLCKSCAGAYMDRLDKVREERMEHAKDSV